MKWVLPLLLIAFTTPCYSAVFGGRKISQIQEDGVDLAKEPKLNFIGAHVTCVQQSTNSRINCTFAAADSSTLSVAEDNVQITSPTVQLNFTGSQFNITESPLFQSNVALSSAVIELQNITFAVGDIVYFDGTKFVVLSTASASEGQVLSLTSSIPAWAAAGSADNLGDHKATTTLNMAGFDVTGISSMTTSSGRDRIFVSTQMSIISTRALHVFEVEGDVGIFNDADGNDRHAIEINADAQAFGDFKAIDIVYKTGAIVTGEDESIILINLDQSAAVGGHVSGLEVLSTEGSADVYGLEVGAVVNPVLQLSGVFVNQDSFLVAGVDQLDASTDTAVNVSMFVLDNDTVTIGNATKFEEIEFLLNTVASGAGINPVFEFSTGLDLWTAFSPIDGTNQMKNSGIIIWDDADIPTWATGTGTEFLIRITRTRNTLTTVPIESKVQIASVVENSWNKDGDVNISTITIRGDLVTSLDCTGNANGGALTADANGLISCSDDDSGAGGGTPLVVQDSGVQVDADVGTMTFNGVLASSQNVSGDVSAFLRFDTSSFTVTASSLSLVETYLQESSATATYLQLSSASATYIDGVTAGNGLTGGGGSGIVTLDVDYSTVPSRADALLDSEALEAKTLHVSSGRITGTFIIQDTGDGPVTFSSLGNQPLMTMRTVGPTDAARIRMTDENGNIEFNLVGLGTTGGFDFQSSTTTGAGVVSRIRLSNQSDDALVRFNDAFSGVDLTIGSMTFNSGSDDPILDWTDDGFLEVANGTFTVAEHFRLTDGAEYDCDGLGNNGKLTVDADGDVVCAQDVSTSGGTPLVIQDSGVEIDADVGTATFNGALISSQNASGDVSVYIGVTEPISISGSSITIDGDKGDVSYSGGVATVDNVAAANIAAGTLGATVIASSIAVNTIDNTHMANNDHGDVSWTSNVATVDSVAAANIAAGTLGATVIASSIAVDTAGIPQLSATGNPDGTTFLRGDNTWTAPAGSGDVVLASTQTHTGAKTHSSTLTANGFFQANSTSDLNGLFFVHTSSSEFRSVSTVTYVNVTTVTFNDGSTIAIKGMLSMADDLLLNDLDGTALTISGNSLGVTADGIGPTQIDETANYVWTGTHDYGGANIEMENSATLTLGNLGEFGLDTTDNVFAIRNDEGVARVYGVAFEHFSVTIGSRPTDGWDADGWPMWEAPQDMAVTIATITATTFGVGGSTVVFNIEERAFGSLNSAGTDVFTVAGSTANNTGVIYTATDFSNSSIAAGAHIFFDTDTGAQTGTADAVHISVWYRRDIE